MGMGEKAAWGRRGRKAAWGLHGGGAALLGVRVACMSHVIHGQIVHHVACRKESLFNIHSNNTLYLSDIRKQLPFPNATFVSKSTCANKLLSPAVLSLRSVPGRQWTGGGWHAHSKPWQLLHPFQGPWPHLVPTPPPHQCLPHPPPPPMRPQSLPAPSPRPSAQQQAWGVKQDLRPCLPLPLYPPRHRPAPVLLAFQPTPLSRPTTSPPLSLRPPLSHPLPTARLLILLWPMSRIRLWLTAPQPPLLAPQLTTPKSRPITSPLPPVWFPPSTRFLVPIRCLLLIKRLPLLRSPLPSKPRLRPLPPIRHLPSIRPLRLFRHLPLIRHLPITRPPAVPSAGLLMS